MAEPADSPITGRKLQGLKYLDKLLPLFDRLHDVGCQRDKAGNRKLHFDHYCALILLFFLNPVLRSFRALQQASLLDQVQRKIGCSATSLERPRIRRPHVGCLALPCRSLLRGLTQDRGWGRFRAQRSSCAPPAKAPRWGPTGKPPGRCKRRAERAWGAG